MICGKMFLSIGDTQDDSTRFLEYLQSQSRVTHAAHCEVGLSCLENKGLGFRVYPS